MQLFAAAFVAAVSGNAVYPAVAHLGPVTTQYHSQDEWGQYAYGYSGGPSAKHEQRTADGVTSGGYSYVDANGLVQSVAYVSDPHNGFRATGTNFPVDTPAAPPAPVVPVVHDVVPAPVPVPVHPWPVVAAAPEHEVLPTVVEARNYLPVHHFAPQPLLKLSKPLTPAATTNLHYPEHAVILAARKKRSADLYPYPLVSAYAAAPHHVVTVKHTEFAAPPAPVLHHVINPAPYVTVHAPIPAPAPVATSYTSVVRHHQPALVPAPEPVIAYAAAPVAVAAPIPQVYVEPHVAVHPTKSQYHSQDEHGQYTYGYTDGASAKTETRYADGVTKGSYSYVDDHGDVQSVHYSAGADGFKAAGTNIPVHHV